MNDRMTTAEKQEARYAASVARFTDQQLADELAFQARRKGRNGADVVRWNNALATESNRRSAEKEISK